MAPIPITGHNNNCVSVHGDSEQVHVLLTRPQLDKRSVKRI